MMHQPVAHSGFVNAARFRVIDFKRMVWTMNVCFVCQIFVQGEQGVVKMQGKFCNIFSFSFTAHKFLPGSEQVFKGNDIVVLMAEPLYSLSLSLSKRLLFCSGSKRGI